MRKTIIDFGIKQDVIDKVNVVFASFPDVEEVIVYGSRAKGSYRPGSDIDIALKGKNLNHNIVSEISNEIDDLLTPYLFDISIFQQIGNPDLVDHIKRVGKVWYKKDNL